MGKPSGARTDVVLAFAGGMAAIAMYVGFTAIAWWFYPSRFTPLKNWLSDLGDHTRNPAGAVYYNVGCVLTAVGLLVFVVGLSRWRAGRPRGHALVATSQLVGLASVFFLVMIGFFSRDQLKQHMVFCNWFFASFPVFIALLSTGLYSHPRFEKSVAFMGFGFLVVGLMFHSIFPSSRPLEWITELGFLIYVALVAINTRKAEIESRPRH